MNRGRFLLALLSWPLLFVSRTFGKSFRHYRSDDNSNLVASIRPEDRTLLFYHVVADGVMQLHGMFDGVSITLKELNWWALMHDGIIDYDEFLLWKMEHLTESYVGPVWFHRSWEEQQGHWYMLGNGTRGFHEARSST